MENKIVIEPLKGIQFKGELVCFGMDDETIGNLVGKPDVVYSPTEDGKSYFIEIRNGAEFIYQDSKLSAIDLPGDFCVYLKDQLLPSTPKKTLEVLRKLHKEHHMLPLTQVTCFESIGLFFSWKDPSPYSVTSQVGYPWMLSVFNSVEELMDEPKK